MALKIILGLWMPAVIYAALFYLPPARGFSDPESARIVVFHVPCAMLAVVAYLTSSVYAVLMLARKNIAYDIRSSASASLGFLFTVLATVTGMVFAHVQWHSAWNWDPRETSIAVLLLVYAAYFALRASIPQQMVRARIAAVYNIIACIAMPYLVFVMPRLTAGLHPDNTLTESGALSTDYRLVLFASMIGFLMLFIWLLRLSIRVNEMEEEKRI